MTQDPNTIRVMVPVDLPDGYQIKSIIVSKNHNEALLPVAGTVRAASWYTESYPQPAPTPQKPQPRDQWEVMSLLELPEEVVSSYYKRLEKIVADGWELVTAVRRPIGGGPENTTELWFKRKRAT